MTTQDFIAQHTWVSESTEITSEGDHVARRIITMAPGKREVIYLIGSPHYHPAVAQAEAEFFMQGHPVIRPNWNIDHDSGRRMSIEELSITEQTMVEMVRLANVLYIVNVHDYLSWTVGEVIRAAKRHNVEDIRYWKPHHCHVHCPAHPYRVDLVVEDEHDARISVGG